ncbi:hypothetical protein [Mucilaginibacter boryungensis]|uniref:Lipocalin-like protein n=1 Tax=Mucilaginibacter boryungensis TaxID=768480 RepID=A0ABR9XNP7_9SPHI|nr:hypothetical protein [Mucilaginibacter boryungensis]MBE9668623.1 hypothetical protein [Mucilaginibacter boryungensis]
MRKLIIVILTGLCLCACQNRPHNTPKEKMLCGQWMTTGEKYNYERYHFKPDGTFTDTEAGSDSPLREAQTWEVEDGQLALTYKNHVVIPFNYTTHYRIISLNDSVLVIAGSSHRRHTRGNMVLKKMKLGGKFIQS